jgi:polyhydroxyalkanoate synthase
MTSSQADVAAFAANLAKIAERSQLIVQEFAARNAGQAGMGAADPLHLSGIFAEWFARMMAEPQKIMELQLGWWQDTFNLWQQTAQKFLGENSEATIEPESRDRRFRDKAWQESIVFDFIKQSYLLTARWIQHSVHKVDGMDPQTRRKIDFYTRQFIDAMAPSNFLLTNPEVLRATLESNGESLVKGLSHMLEDLEQSKGPLRVSMTDMQAFEVGGNLAVSKGKVVFENDLMQLIQYEPLTKEVHRTPLLIIPPWINKFYILDLQPENSMVRWLVEQGYTVFVVSWVNPDTKLGGKGFDDYLKEGPLAAFDAIEAATGEKDVNVIGYCLGGTLLAITLSYLQHAARQRSDLVVRGQQLPARQGPLPLRPALLEFRFHAHARRHAQLLLKADVPAEPARQARRHYACRRAGASGENRNPGLSAFHARGSHRAVEIHLCRHAYLQGTDTLRARGQRAYRGRRQPALAA